MGPVPRIVLVLISTAVFLALAIVGWGGVAAFFAHAALWAVAMAVALLVIVAYFAGCNVRPGVREDRPNSWVFGAFSVISLLAGFAGMHRPHRVLDH